MQPYFIPYPGYYRLLTTTDCFVIYDCVQFPRRGFVHRNRYPYKGSEKWLTLPLQKAPREATINQLKFKENASEILTSQIKGMLHQHQLKPNAVQEEYLASICDCHGSVTNYLTRQLINTMEYLELPLPDIVFSSSLNIDSEIRARKRVLAICEKLNVKEYINAPGGRSLYSESDFSEKGIKLSFLPDYEGDPWSILYQILTRPNPQLRRDIMAL